MVLKNAIIVLPNEQFNGYVAFENGKIIEVGKGSYGGKDNAIDCNGNILMPGFIDIHIHGCNGIDFMDADAKDYEGIAKSLYSEGVTTFLATTLTSDKESLAKVCRAIAAAKKNVPSLGGIQFEGPYICTKYKGAQNPEFIRNPDINEFDDLNKISENNVRYIALAPENDGALDFIKHVTSKGVAVAVGHSDATFDQVSESIKVGLTNVTHTHNAQSGHHHRNPGVVSAAFYFNELYTEFICDKIHVCPNTLKTSFKIIGEDRFVIITDSLKIKHSNIDKFDMFGLPAIRKDGAAYLESGPLAGSLLTMDQGVRNMRDVCNLNLSQLSKISSKNAANSIHFDDRGEIKVGNLADFVLLDKDLKVLSTYKLGEKVF